MTSLKDFAARRKSNREACPVCHFFGLFPELGAQVARAKTSGSLAINSETIFLWLKDQVAVPEGVTADAIKRHRLGGHDKGASWST